MNKKMIYITSPKCASQSIISVLEEKYIWSDVRLSPYTGKYYTSDSGGDTNPTSSFDELDVLKVPFWRPPVSSFHYEGVDLETVPESYLFSDDYYKWTVVRNPWHRLASSFEHLNRHKKACYESEYVCSFEDWVRASCTTPFPIICPHLDPERYIRSFIDQGTFNRLSMVGFIWTAPWGGCGHIGAAFSLWPWHYMMSKCDRELNVHTQRWENSAIFSGSSTIISLRSVKEIIHGAGDNVSESLSGLVTAPHASIEAVHEIIGEPHPLDQVVRFENLEGGIEELCSNIGEPTWTLPHFKNTKKFDDKARHYEEMYTAVPELIELVEKWYKYEINTFGYEFGHYL